MTRGIGSRMKSCSRSPLPKRIWRSCTRARERVSAAAGSADTAASTSAFVSSAMVIPSEDAPLAPRIPLSRLELDGLGQLEELGQPLDGSAMAFDADRAGLLGGTQLLAVVEDADEGHRVGG